MSISLCSRLNFGELREICYIRVVPSLTLGPVWLFLVVANRADLAVLAQDLREMRESAWFAVNSFCWLVQGRLLFLCGLHEIGVTRGYRWRMARNLLSSRAIPFICLQKTD